MTIKVGDKIPDSKFRVMTGDGPQWKSTDEVFKGKKVALFAVPGAFTGTCHKMHMPSITMNADAMRAKGRMVARVFVRTSVRKPRFEWTATTRVISSRLIQ